MTDPVGTFSHAMKNNSFTRDDDGTLIATVDFEGTAEGFGTVLSTLRVPLPTGGAPSGSCTWMGRRRPDRGDDTAPGTGSGLSGRPRVGNWGRRGYLGTDPGPVPVEAECPCDGNFRWQSPSL